MEKNTNPLYLLRFIAAIIVVLYHFTPQNDYDKLAFLMRNGGEAVIFFFFISGFVMIISNTKNYFADINTTFSKPGFYIKRFARIYPLYLFAILAQAFFHYGIHSIDTKTVKYRLPFEVLGIQKWLYSGSFNAPGWTISCEFFFYLLFPFIIFYMRKSMKQFTVFVFVYFISSVVVGIAVYYLSHYHLLRMERFLLSTMYQHPILLISVFLFGMLSGKLFLDDKITFFKDPWNSRIAIVLSVIAIFTLKYYLPKGVLDSGLLAPLHFVLVMAITSFKRSDTKIFNTKALVFLGNISFGIYILQAPVSHYYTYFYGELTDLFSLSCYVISLIIVASITYYTIELPVKKLILGYAHKRAVSINSKKISEAVDPIL